MQDVIGIRKFKDQFDQITEIKGVGEKLAGAILADMSDVLNFQKSG